jgi:hypothetical protein
VLQQMHAFLQRQIKSQLQQVDQSARLLYTAPPPFAHLASVGSEQADDSAEITLLGSGAQGRDDAMQQALSHSIRILFLDPPLRR